MTAERALRADARRSREAILLAARAVFEKDEPLRFDDFAARAGVGVGTLYRHFPTRESLAAALYEEEIVALCASPLKSAGPAVEVLATFLRGYTHYIQEHAALARALSGLVDSATQAAGGSELERTIGDLLARAVREGDVTADVDAGAVMVVLHGVGSSIGRPRWSTESRMAIDLFIRGLAIRPSQVRGATA